MSVRLSECIAPAFHALHRDVAAGGHREYWLRGGRGSGKSSFISLEILLGMLRHPEASAIVYRKVAATLRESVYEQMVWAVERLGLAACFRMRLSPLTLEYLPTGQRILFRGADDPGKSKSLKLSRGYFGYLWFEELAEFSGMEDVRSIAASVVRGGPTVIFASYNPPASRRSWVNAEARAHAPQRLVHTSDYRDMPPEWLGADFLAAAEALRTGSERVWRAMYLGEETGTGAQVFDNLCLRAPTPEELLGADRIYCGLDFGFAADPDAFVKVAVDERRSRLILLDEFFGVRTPVDRLLREVSARSDGGLVRCDSAEPRLIRQLRDGGLNAVGARKGPGSVEAGIRWLQERAAIVIDPAACPNAAREFAGYEYPPDGFGGFLNEPPDRDNHTIDAVRYAVEGLQRPGGVHTRDRAQRPRRGGRTFAQGAVGEDPSLRSG